MSRTTNARRSRARSRFSAMAGFPGFARAPRAGAQRTSARAPFARRRRRAATAPEAVTQRCGVRRRGEGLELEDREAGSDIRPRAGENAQQEETPGRALGEKQRYLGHKQAGALGSRRNRGFRSKSASAVRAFKRAPAPTQQPTPWPGLWPPRQAWRQLRGRPARESGTRGCRSPRLTSRPPGSRPRVSVRLSSARTSWRTPPPALSREAERTALRDS